METVVLISSPSDPVTRNTRNIQHFSREDSDLTGGNPSFPRGWPNIGISCLERWSIPHASQFLRDI